MIADRANALPFPSLQQTHLWYLPIYIHTYIRTSALHAGYDTVYLHTLKCWTPRGSA